MSNELPYLPFFVSDFLVAVSTWPAERVGAYTLALCYQFEHGGLPADNEPELARILHVSRSAGRRLWIEIGNKFHRRDDGLWWNQRLEVVRAFARDKVEKDSARGKAGAAARWGKGANGAQARARAMPKHSMGNSSQVNTDLPIKERSEDRTPVVPETSAALRGRFDAFWQEYPKKAAKGTAWKVWERLKPSAEQTSEILAAIRQQRASRQWRAGYIPNPATWLNGERWSDEPEIQVDRGGAPMPFWDECAKCGDIHPTDQPCPPKVQP